MIKRIVSGDLPHAGDALQSFIGLLAASGSPLRGPYTTRAKSTLSPRGRLLYPCSPGVQLTSHNLVSSTSTFLRRSQMLFGPDYRPTTVASFNHARGMASGMLRRGVPRGLNSSTASRSLAGPSQGFQISTVSGSTRGYQELTLGRGGPGRGIVRGVVPGGVVRGFAVRGAVQGIGRGGGRGGVGRGGVGRGGVGRGGVGRGYWGSAS